ncbi:MAG: sulfotransferase domain-containing protein [Lachnospiraceae bacterium]|nr:sulfotransferase domain-containing protein [Lachnospiraceae bacterium]
MERNLSNTEALIQYLKGKDRVVIYGGGKYARRLIEYMIFINEVKAERMIVTKLSETDCGYKGVGIQEAIPFLKENGDCNVVIATSAVYWEDITQVVSKYVQEYHCITDQLFFEMGKELDVPFKNIDFIVGGFGKCGTTSLFKALIGGGVFLPDKKESQFFLWYHKVKNPKEKLRKEYFNNVQNGQAVGMIEPTFYNHAEDVYDYFGDKLKILFLVRNPVDAEFSKFKMDNRNGVAGLEQSYQKSGEFYPQMFDEYFQLDTQKDMYEYAKWIEQYKKYYPDGQIKLIFFEDLIKNFQVVIQDILEFIGVSAQYEQRKFPLENKGDFVMADTEGYKLAGLLHQLGYEIFCLDVGDEQRKCELRSRYGEVLEQYSKADKVTDLRITDIQRKTMEKYYFDSVRQLERLANRDLSRLWF